MKRIISIVAVLHFAFLSALVFCLACVISLSEAPVTAEEVQVGDPPILQEYEPVIIRCPRFPGSLGVAIRPKG